MTLSSGTVRHLSSRRRRATVIEPNQIQLVPWTDGTYKTDGASPCATTLFVAPIHLHSHLSPLVHAAIHDAGRPASQLLRQGNLFPEDHRERPSSNSRDMMPHDKHRGGSYNKSTFGHSSSSRTSRQSRQSFIRRRRPQLNDDSGGLEPSARYSICTAAITFPSALSPLPNDNLTRSLSTFPIKFENDEGIHLERPGHIGSPLKNEPKLSYGL